MKVLRIGRAAVCAAVALATTAAFAFMPPVDEADGLSVSLPEFTKDWEQPPLDVSAGIDYCVVVSNGSEKAVSGVLKSYLNGDWRVSQGEIALTVSPGEVRTNSFSAKAVDLSRIENSHYPIWADFTASNGGLSRPLRAVGVFRASNAAKENWSRTREPWEWFMPDKNGNLPQDGELWKAEIASDDEGEWAKRERLCLETPLAVFSLSEGIKANVGIGEQGVTDGVIMFTQGGRSFAYRGFAVCVGGKPVGAAKEGLRFSRVETRKGEGDSLEVLHHLPESDGKDVVLRAKFFAKGGVLRLAWDMPGTVRTPGGDPRYTFLHVGPGSELVERAYAGFGNVYVKPRKLILRAGANKLSTRHVGMDYPCGISVVQATDVYPDYFLVRENGRASHLLVHHDATFSFAVSAAGAFAAARAFANVAEYRRSPGYEALADRICLDVWWGAYSNNTAAIRRYAEYGVTNAVYLRHGWQRWGYDNRLPDVCPPNGDEQRRRDFVELAATARQFGMRFGIHDNFIDFYPDAEGFDYNVILFNHKGKPCKGWMNGKHHAQSYWFNSNMIWPWLERNMTAERRLFAPTALFVDVFSAMQPLDGYDRNGVLIDRRRCAENWGSAFDKAREFMGVGDAPTVSEGGTDALIGHLDAGQADHHLTKQDELCSCEDVERVPWHDIVTHGKMALMGGGLEERYAGRTREKRLMAGYGSDDYLETTAIGGRMPLCSGDIARESIVTDWMLRGWWQCVSRCDMTGFEFQDGNIRHRCARFANGAEICSNRETNFTWRVDGVELPPCGFYAKGPGFEGGVVVRDGCRAGFARTPQFCFFDARPIFDDPGREGLVRAGTTDFARPSERVCRIGIGWRVRNAVAEDYMPFVHVVSAASGKEKIAFGGKLELPLAETRRHGAEVHGAVVVNLPKDIEPGEYDVRYGLYRNNRRMEFDAVMDGVTRIVAGTLTVTRDDSGALDVKWTPPRSVDDVEREFARRLERNFDGRLVDFGEVKTDGAFRLTTEKDSLTVTTLPGSRPFRARFDLARLGFSNRPVCGIRRAGKDEAAAPMKRRGDDLAVAFGEGEAAWTILFK